METIKRVKYFRKKKYFIIRFRDYFFNETILLSFKKVYINNYGDYILGDLHKENFSGMPIIGIYKDTYFYLTNSRDKYNIRLDEEKYKNEVIDDINSAKLLFELGE